MICISKKDLFAKLDYVPHEGQQQFHDSIARFKVLIAGARFGKSWAAAMEALPLILLPNTRGWIVGPTYILSEKEFRYIREALDELGVEISSCSTLVTAGSLQLRTPWGSEVFTKSCDRPESLLGEELDWMILSEGAQIRELIWDRYLRARLSSRNGIMILPTTPKGRNWVHRAFLLGQDPEAGMWESWQFSTEANPHQSKFDIAEAKSSLDERSFNEQYHGQFISYAGQLVYSNFRRETHVTDEFPVGTKWDPDRLVREPKAFALYRSIDFGFANPFCCLFATLDEDGDFFIFDEHYQDRRITSHHIKKILARPGEYLLTFADPSAPQLIADLRASSIPTRKASNNVIGGIDAVRSGLVVKGNGRPSILIHPRCHNLIRELESYHYGEDELSERPEKIDDHAADALRYLVYSLRAYCRRNV